MNDITHRLSAISRSFAWILPLLLIAAAPAFAEDLALLYEEGLSAFQDGDFRTAKIRTKNAIKADPTQISAHILLARIHLREGDGELAEKELIVAERLGASRQLTVIPLAHAYLLQNKYKVLLDNLYPAFAAPEIDSELLELRGKAYVELREYTDALRSFEQAAEQMPERASALLNIAVVMMRQNRLAEAEAEIIAALKLEPENARSWLLKGKLNQAAGNTADALVDFDKAVELQPTLIEARIDRINLLMAFERNDSALAAAERLVEEYPRSVKALYVLAVAQNKNGEQKTAQETMRKAATLVDLIPDELLLQHAPSLLLSAVLHFSLKDWEKALSHLESYIRINPEHAGARKMAGTILLSKNEVDKAIVVLDPALITAPEDYALLTLLGEAYSKAGRHFRAAELFDKAVKLEPESPAARAQRALNNLARGEEESAIRDLDQVFESRPGSGQIGVQLVLAHMKSEAYEAAMKTAQRLVQHHPDNIAYLHLLASTQSSAGDVEAARDSYDRVLAMDPQFLPAQINLGKLDYLYGSAEEAEQRLRHLQKQHPDNADVMYQLARSLQMQDKLDDARSWLRRAIAKNPKQYEATSVLVDLLISGKRFDEALKTAQRAEVDAPRNLTVLGAVGRAYLALGQEITAKSVFRNMSKIAGYESGQLMRIAVMQRQAGDLKGAIWSLEKATDQKPAFLKAQVLLVELLVQDGKMEKAVERADAIVKLTPNAPAGHLLSGNLAIREKRLDQAFEHFRQASKLGAGVNARLGIARIHVLRRQEASALKVLEELRQKHPDNLRIRVMLASVHLRLQAWDSAKAEYEYIIENDQSQAAPFNNLAYIYDMQGHPKAAEYARKALELAPKSASINDTLGWILVRRGKVPEGLKHLRNATALEPGNSEIHYHLASALHQIGNDVEARRELEAALLSKQRYTWTVEAEALLAKLQ